MNNPQVRQTMHQTQYIYLYQYICLNLLSIGDSRLRRDIENIFVFQWSIEIFALIAEKAEKNDAERAGKDDLQWAKKDGMENLPLKDIMTENGHSRVPLPGKPGDDLILPEKRPDKVPLITLAGSKKPSVPPEKKFPEKNKNYKSPPGKLLVFFEKSRDQWKSKCLDAKKELKLAKKNVKNLRAANKKLKREAKHLEAELSKASSAKEILEQEVHELQKTADNIEKNMLPLNAVPARHQYPIGVMYLYVSLVLDASASLRGAEKSLEIFMSALNFDCSAPSWPCGRLWLLRLGYYKLTRPKEKSDDWIWLADHVVQIGKEKCFVIYGLHQSSLSDIDRALTYEDLEPLAVLPVTESSGEIVFRQLEQTIEQTGIPREIIGDHGSDIKKGIDEFCRKYPQTDYIHDIKHKIALILKHEFEKDNDFNEFAKLCSQIKQKIQQTALAFLNPKNQRAKARWMNIDTLIEWGIQVLAFLEEQAGNPSEQLDQKAVREKFDWIRGYSLQLKEWSDIIRMIKITEQFIREKGIRGDCCRSLKKLLQPVSDITKRVKRVRGKILDFIKLESLKAGLGEKLLGSSEIIESAFGKLKQTEKDQSKSGFTGLALMLAAIVSTTNMDILFKALESVPVQKVIDWCKQNIGESVQSKRKKFLKGSKRKKFPEGYKNKEQKRRKLFCAI